MEKSTLSKKKLHDNLFVYALIGYPLLLFIIFYVVVNFNSILLSFKTIDGTGTNWANPLFKNFTEFFTQMFSDGALLEYSFFNSIKMYLINLAITTPLSFLFSYVLFKKCWGSKTLTLLGMIPNMMSGLVISLVVVRMIAAQGPITQLCKTLGWFGGKWPNFLNNKEYAFTFTTLYSIWLSFAMSFVMLPTSMRGISEEIFDSSKIDGVSNMFQEIWYIIFPLIYPTLSTFWITGFAGIFSTTGPLVEFYDNAAPDYVYNMGYFLTVEFLHGGSGSEFSYPMYAAGGIILTVIIAPLTFLVKWALEKFGPSEE